MNNLNSGLSNETFVDDTLEEVPHLENFSTNLEVSERRKVKLHGIWKQIKSRTTEHLTVRRLALENGFTESKLKFYFQALFEESINACIYDAKMQAAFRLLMEDRLPIKEIARLSGYTTQQNFTTAFRKFFKCTPGSLRRKEQLAAE